jgi:hypothetical protein
MQTVATTTNVKKCIRVVQHKKKEVQLLRTRILVLVLVAYFGACSQCQTQRPRICCALPHLWLHTREAARAASHTTNAHKLVNCLLRMPIRNGYILVHT